MEKLNDTIILRVSKADRERIRAKMDELGVMNMSAYIRKMALDGYCVKLDLQELKEEIIRKVMMLPDKDVTEMLEFVKALT